MKEKEEKEEKNSTNLQGVKKMNIFEKMSKITNEIEKVRKNLKVGEGKMSYKAVAEKDVLDAVKKVEEKYRVYSYPANRELVESQIMKKVGFDKNGEQKEINIFYSKIKTTYKFVNIDDLTESLEMITFSEGIDTGDKGFGKAMTYGDKYALLKAYKIETDDDPDTKASPEDVENLTLEEALKDVCNIGKYKGKNKLWYDVYLTDKSWLDYITSGDVPNQIAIAHVKLFDEMSINKLRTLVNELKSFDSLKNHYNIEKLEDLTEEQVKEAIVSLENYKNIKNKQTNNMLEQAERELNS